MPDQSKSYRAGFRLGETSDTQDVTGKILSSSDMPVSLEELNDVIPLFTGKIMQLPPMYSAVQVGGRRLYDLARQGIEVEREPREIIINKLTLENYDSESRQGTLFIDCSKGTYIRTIISDIGEKLGCGGIMTELERTSSSGFELEDCYTFPQIQAAADEDRLGELIIPIERAFAKLPKLRLGEAQTRMYRCGVKLDLSRIFNILDNAENYAVYGFDGAFIGTAKADRSEGVLRVEKNLG